MPFAFWFVRGRRFFRGVDRYSRGIESEKRLYLFVTLSLTAYGMVHRPPALAWVEF